MQTIYKSLDINHGPFGIHQTLYVVSRYVNRIFDLHDKERNFETAYDKYKKGEIKINYSEKALTEVFFLVKEYMDMLLTNLSKNPHETKSKIPNWLEFLMRKTITIEDSRITVYTSSLNFTNIESFVTKLLDFLVLPTTFMGHEAEFKIDYSSIRIENMTTVTGENYFYDDFERLGDRYKFDICFNLFLTSKDIFPFDIKLKRYKTPVNAEASENFEQIIQDMLLNPGSLTYSAESQTVYLTPITLKDAEEMFCRRHINRRRLSFGDLLRVANPQILPQHARLSRLIYLNQEIGTADDHFPGLFLQLQTHTRQYIDALNQFLLGNHEPLLQLSLKTAPNSLWYRNTVQIKADQLLKRNSKTIKKVLQYFLDLQDTLENINKRAEEIGGSSPYRTLLTKMQCERILEDPLSYVDDKDDIISELANVLLTGI